MHHNKSLFLTLLFLMSFSALSAESQPEKKDFSLKSERGPTPPENLYAVFFLDDGSVVIGHYDSTKKEIIPLTQRDNRTTSKKIKLKDDGTPKLDAMGNPELEDVIDGEVKFIRNPSVVKKPIGEKNILSWRPYHLWPSIFDVSAELMGGVEYAFFTTTAEGAATPDEKETERTSLPFIQINLDANPFRPEPNQAGWFALTSGFARFSSNLVEGSDITGQITKANAASIGGEVFAGYYFDDAIGFPTLLGTIAMGRYDYYDEESVQGSAQGTNAFGIRMASKYDFNSYVQVDMGRVEPINSRLMSIRTQLPVNLDFINPTNIYITIAAQLSYDDWNRTKDKDNLMFGVSYIIDVSELKKAARGLIK